MLAWCVSLTAVVVGSCSVSVRVCACCATSGSTSSDDLRVLCIPGVGFDARGHANTHTHTHTHTHKGVKGLHPTESGQTAATTCSAAAENGQQSCRLAALPTQSSTACISVSRTSKIQLSSVLLRPWLPEASHCTTTNQISARLPRAPAPPPTPPFYCSKVAGAAGLE